MSRFWKHFIRNGSGNDATFRSARAWLYQPVLGLMIHPVRLPAGQCRSGEPIPPTALEIIGMASVCPAAEAGLQEGDLLVGLGETVVGSIADLQAALQTSRAGVPVSIRFLRGRRLLERLIVPTDSPDPAELR